jgi:hypothetical protein
MSSVTSSWRQRRHRMRTRQALADVAASGGGPALRNEMLALAYSSRVTELGR